VTRDWYSNQGREQEEKISVRYRDKHGVESTNPFGFVA
jgi:hypothetical protein